MNSVRNRAEDGYFAWLCRKVGVYYGGPHEGASGLMWQLHSIDFRYSVSNDVNRVNDGLLLRDLYQDETGCEMDLGWPCSVLEMMVGICRRLCDDILGDESGGKLIEKWFWRMISNLGLLKFSKGKYDRGEVCIIIENWLARNFDSAGVGSPFPLKDPKFDQRKVEIWAQMYAYLAENPGMERV